MATQTLEARAQARWDALIRRDFAAAYTFSTPKFRARVPASAFSSRFGGDLVWDSAQVAKVEFQDAGKANVEILVNYRPINEVGELGGIRGAGITETWVNDEGGWWIDLAE